MSVPFPIVYRTVEDVVQEYKSYGEKRVKIGEIIESVKENLSMRGYNDLKGVKRHIEIAITILDGVKRHRDGLVELL